MMSMTKLIIDTLGSEWWLCIIVELLVFVVKVEM